MIQLNKNNWNILSKFKASRGKRILTILSLVLAVILLMTFIYSAYNKHKDIVVEQQKEHLLTIAETVSRNLETVIKESEHNIDMYFDEFSYSKDYSRKDANSLLRDSIDKFYIAQYNNMDSIYLINSKGQFVYRQGIDSEETIPSYLKDVNDPFLKEALKKGGATIGPVFMSKGKYFLLGIIKPVAINGDPNNFILCTINLDKIYERFIAPIKVGQRGYILVKDSSSRIIMYKDKEQVGLDVLEGRKEKYPDLDYTDLENLLKRQMAGETGTEIYYSYWWTEKNIKRVQKINAFTPVNLEKDFWVISVQMDYQEVESPVKNNLNNILFLSFIILVILCFSIFFLMRMAKNTQALEIETRYLKELNDTFNELQKSEEKAKHYQKLKTIGTMTGGIAHEFNNLLTPILGYCEIILNEIPRSSQTSEDVSEIYKIARKASDLVKQLLVYGRHDTGMHMFKLLNISSFVKESLKTVKKLMPASIELIERIDPDCGYIHANSTMINQVLLNLCTNSIHAMKDTQGTLTIELQKVERNDIPELQDRRFDSEAYVLLKISDTGSGMDEETMKSIFDPFFTTKGVSEGTGLGLWVVQNIVLEHKGEILVQSQKGKGSTFSVYLPWSSQDIEEQSEEQNMMAYKRGIRILLVEDEFDVVKVLKKGLAQLGYEVQWETDPTVAIVRYKANPENYDVVITDYSMPKTTGVELSSIVKNINRDVKTILITGFIDKKVDELVENSKIDGFLLKPVSCRDLDKKIQSLFKI